jgi:hypothetical protein
MNNLQSLRPHMIHFARIRDQYRPIYVNWLLSRCMRDGDAWNRLMALIYAS